MKFILNKSSIKQSLLGILFALMGFGQFKLYAPVLFLFISIYWRDYVKFNISISGFLFLTTNILFITFLFLIGSSNMTIPNPLMAFISLFIFTFFLIIVSYQEGSNKDILIGTYTFGIFIRSIVVVAYSYYQNPLIYGYGKLLDPFSMEEVNSPGYGNNLAIAFIVFIYIFHITHNKLLKILSICILMISIWGGLFLAGRTFFFATVLFLVFYFITIFSYKNLLNIFISIILISIIILYFYDTLDDLSQVILNRFSEAGGNSNRFKHWADALPKIIDYPMGGFRVNQMIEHTKWLHNLWLDTARAGGWLPLLALLYATMFTPYLTFKLFSKNENSKLLLMMLYIALMILAQDVVIEGNWKILFFYFIVVSTLLSQIHLNKILTYHKGYSDVK